MLHLKEPTSTQWLQALSTKLDFIPFQITSSSLLKMRGWLISMTARVPHLVIPGHTTILAWPVFELRQPRNQKAAVETTGNYKPSSPSQSASNRSDVLQCLVTCYLQGAPHSPDYLLCTESMSVQSKGSTEHDKGSIQMSVDYSIRASDSVQNQELYGMNLLIQITLYQRQPPFPRLRNGNSIFLPHRTLIYRII